MNQELRFVWSGFEDVPRRVAYRKGLVQPRGEGREIGGISGGGGVKVCTEQQHRALVVNRASKGKGKGAIGLSEDRGSHVWEVGCNFERFWMGFEGSSGGEESADGLGERRGRFRENLDATATEEAEAVPFV